MLPGSADAGASDLQANFANVQHIHDFADVCLLMSTLFILYYYFMTANFILCQLFFCTIWLYRKLSYSFYCTEKLLVVKTILLGTSLMWSDSREVCHLNKIQKH